MNRSIVQLPAILARLPDSLLPLELSELDDAVRSGDAVSRAAVLILLFPRGDEPAFYLTARPETLTRHPGQISLPGGRAEADDPSLWETALRETREELGVATDRVLPLGRLDTYHMPFSNYVIAPFVAWSPGAPAPRPDRREVAELFEVPVRWLLDPLNVGQEVWHRRGKDWRVTFYRFGERTVWGATARILHELAWRIAGEPREAADPPGSVDPLA